MQLRVSTMIHECELNDFVLQAGIGGLQNPVIDVGILDHEYDLNATVSEPKFDRNSFVISSMMFAKNDPAKLTLAVHNLITEQVSGLALQPVYFSKLPKEVIELANACQFPIFIIGEKADYLENIIFKIKKAIDENFHLDFKEAKIEQALTAQSPIIRQKKLQEAGVPTYHRYSCLYFLHDDHSEMTKVEIENTRLYFASHSKLPHYVLRFQNGILVLANLESISISYQKVLTPLVLSIFKSHSLNLTCGVSSPYTEIIDLDKALDECRFALKIADKQKKIVFYEDLGILKLIANISDISEVETIVFSMVNQLQKENPTLFDTLTTYISHSGDIIQCAEQMYVHPNTVRYRLKKIQEILAYDKEFDMINDMSFIIKIYDIITQ